MSRSPSFVPPRISAARTRPHNKENGQIDGSALAKAAFVAAARLGDFKTIKELVDLGVAREFMPDFDIKEKKNLADMIITKIENIQHLISTRVAYVPSPRFVERSPFARGLFRAILIPGTEVKTPLMINPSGVRAWDPSTNPEGYYPLHLLCSLPDVPAEAVQYLLECNPVDINQGTNTGYTALIIAVVRGNYPLVKLLIGSGALQCYGPVIYVKIKELGSYYPYIKVFSPIKVNFPQMLYYFTPFEAAVFANNEDILHFLVRNGANVHANNGLWSSLFHPIVTGRRRIVERLLEFGVNINGCDLLGTSPLHKAAGEGLIDLTYVLMRRGANVNAKDKYGWTPLHVACLFSRNVSLEMIQLLLDGGADIKAKTRFGFTPLCLAEAGNDLFFLEYLAENMEKLGNTSTHICMPEEDSRKEHEDIMTLLLDNGAGLNDKDDFMGWTALHWAAAAGDLRTARLLVSRGAKVNIRSKFKLNAYQTALYFNRGPVSAYLMTVNDEAPIDL